MREGCQLSSAGYCSKYSIKCYGHIQDKECCPLWGKVFEYKLYLQNKTEFEEQGYLH